MSLTQFAPPPPATSAGPARRRARVPASVIVVALVLAALVGRHAVVTWQNRSPYPASAVAAQVSAQAVPGREAQAKLDQLAGPGRLSAPFVSEARSRHVIVGQLTLRTPRSGATRGHYALFVLDKWDSNRPVAGMWGIGPVGTNVGQGWEGLYDKVAHKYDWLDTLASPRLPDGSYGEAGMAVFFAASDRGPVTFTAQLRDPADIPSDLSRRITLALVFLGDDGQVFWADRLFG